METADIDRLRVGGLSLMNGKTGDIDTMSWVLGQLTVYMCGILDSGIVTMDECHKIHDETLAATPERVPWSVWFQLSATKFVWPVCILFSVMVATKSPIADVAAAYIESLLK